MKVISVAVKPFRLERLKEALAAHGVAGLTVTETSGFGRQGGHVEVYRGAEYRVELIPRLKVDVLVDDEDVDDVLTAITTALRTGKTGDGKVWVSPVHDALRIRTGESGSDAL
jgi:nitrogen regulatory protein P-II 1